MIKCRPIVVFAAVLSIAAIAVAAPDVFRAPLKLRDESARARAEPFKGVTTDGKAVPGLFALAQTGVSTEPVRTPNGNDYGKDLLRQHHERHAHGAATQN